MKVLLINPPASYEIIGNNPSIIESERGHNPPLGILYIAAYLEKFSDHEISVIDAQAEGLDYGALANRIRDISPDVVGITAMTFTMVDVVRVLRVVKETKPGAYTVIGGPHVFIYPEETLRLRDVDFVVLGEGEMVFKELLDLLENGYVASGIRGVMSKKDLGSIDVAKIRIPLIEDLDRLPHPARHLTPYRKYSSILARRTPVTTLFTSRGCPFRCSFCSRPHLGKKYRARSPENVVEEMEACRAMGIRDFLIYDDTFTVIKERVIRICDLVVSRKLKISWDCRARIDTVDEEMLAVMKKAGCTGIHYGIEAGTRKTLSRLRKDIDLDEAKKVCDATHRQGIRTLNYFMIGSPGENLQDIEKTFETMNWLRADYIHLTVFTPFPGTEIYSDGLKSGIIKEDYWKKFAESPEEGFVPPHWPENFSLEELRELIVKGYKRFYLKPSNMLKIVSGIKSPGELLRKARAGMKVILMR
ncbi:MAG: radical SAM protein [Elusimicrobia bacterium]|nr:radical SAM protein [Elusimicrobiota bacterium]